MISDNLLPLNFKIIVDSCSFFSNKTLFFCHCEIAIRFTFNLSHYWVFTIFHFYMWTFYVMFFNWLVTLRLVVITEVQVKESKWLVKCFLNYLRHDKTEVNVLFDILSIFLFHTRIDYTFLKEFYIIEVLWFLDPNFFNPGRVFPCILVICVICY